MSVRVRWSSLLGSRFSVDPVAWLLVTPIGIVAAPLAAPTGALTTDGLGRWLLIGLLAQLPLGIVLLSGGVLARRMPNTRIVIIAVTLLAGAARGLALAYLGDSPGVLVRMTASAVTIAIWLQVIGAARESHHRFDAEVEGLLAQLVARELHGRLLDVAETDSARESSTSRIAETSSEIRAIVEDPSGDHVRTAALLQAAIETRLRPLSHDLWFSPAPIAPQVHGDRERARRIMTARVPVRTLFLASLLLLSWGSAVLHGSWRGACVGVTIAVVYGLVLAVASMSWLAPAVGAVIRYVGTMILPALAGAAAIALLHLGEPWSPLAVALGLPVITAGVAAAGIARSDRAELIEELRARLVDPDWDRHLGELVRREVDTSTATMLHNTVQPALTAAALQLRLAAALDEPERARAALGRATRALDEAQGRHDEPSGRARLERLAETWQGIAEVEMRLPADLLQPQEWRLLADVIDETIANAVRHGGATSLFIDISATSDTIVIAVDEDSLVESRDGSAGLGRTWLNTVVTSSTGAATGEGRRARTMTIPRGSVC